MTPPADSINRNTNSAHTSKRSVGAMKRKHDDQSTHGKRLKATHEHEASDIDSSRHKHSRKGPVHLDVLAADEEFTLNDLDWIEHRPPPPAVTINDLGCMKHANSLLNLIEIEYRGTVSYVVGTSDELQKYEPRLPCHSNELAGNIRHGWPLLFD